MQLHENLKKYLFSMISIEFTDRKNTVSGFLLDYSDLWILLQSNPVDFIIDGYILVRVKNIDDVYQEESDEFTEKVIRLKGFIPTYTDKLPLNDTTEVFKLINERHGIFSFYKKSETTLYPGRLLTIDEETLSIEWIDTRGKWTEERSFKVAKIRTVEFGNDYLNSLKIASEVLY